MAGHRPVTSIAVSAAALLLVGALAAGCGGSAPSATPGTDLGSFPIAYPPPQLAATPVARPGKLVLLVMGDAARAEFSDGTVAVVRASGPDFAYQGGGTPAASSRGTMQLSVQVESGQLTVRASDLTALNDAGQLVRLDVQPASVTVRTGSKATLTISGVFISGDSNLTWAPPGHIVITWDFSTELD